MVTLAGLCLSFKYSWSTTILTQVSILTVYGFEKTYYEALEGSPLQGVIHFRPNVKGNGANGNLLVGTIDVEPYTGGKCISCR